MSQTISVGGISADLILQGGDKVAQDLAKLQAATKQVEAEMVRLTSVFRQNGMSLAEYNSQTNHFQATLKELEKAEQAVTQAMSQQTSAVNAAAGATGRLGTGMQEVSARSANVNSASGNMARGMIQLGYAIDDVQYGFRGVVNNIAPFTYSISAAAGASNAASAGIAAGAQVAAVAVYQLYVHWGEFTDLLGVSPVRTEAQEMEVLGAKTKKTADEQERLNKYKKEQIELAAMMAGKSKEDVQSEHKTQELFNEIGPGKVMAAIVQAQREDGTMPQLSPDERQRLFKQAKAEATKEIAAMPRDPNRINPMLTELGPKTREKFEEKETRARDAAAAKNARDLMLKAKQGGAEGKAAREQLDAIALKHPNLFPDSFRNSLEAASPEAIKEDEQRKKTEHAEDEKDRKEKERLAKVKKDDDLSKQLNEQGQRFQEEGKKAEAQHAKEFDREAVEKAKKAVPGISDIAEQTALANRVKQQLGQRIEKSTVKSIEERLIGEGKMDKKDAHVAAVQLAENGNQSIGEKIQRKLIHGDDEKVTKSETFSASELANRVQGGVSNENPAKKHTSQFDVMIGLLTNIQKNKFFFTET